jgi:hypothetical protein
LKTQTQPIDNIHLVKKVTNGKPETEKTFIYFVRSGEFIKIGQSNEDEMRRAVVKAEQAGYDKGVAHMKNQGLCVEPQKHVA